MGGRDGVTDSCNRVRADVLLAGVRPLGKMRRSRGDDSGAGLAHGHGLLHQVLQILEQKTDVLTELRGILIA